MTLLDVITKASANTELHSSLADHPIVLNADDIFLKLKPEADNPNPTSLVSPLTGWGISETDAKLIELSKMFYTKLNRKQKDIHNFNKEEFLGMLTSFLEKIMEKGGIFIGVDSNDSWYTSVLLEKVGSLIGGDVLSLVLEACISLEIWELLEVLILNGLINHSCFSNLIVNLAAKKRSDLLCLCVKHSRNLGSVELLCILKYFLCLPKDGYASMVNVRKAWESQALLAIEKARLGKKSRFAKEAAILLMVAHDGFSDAELCLHFLLASNNVDEVILSSSLGKLVGKELMNLIKYLGKWLKKYERFPQAIPCPKASSALGLKICDWVPKLEDVAKCLGFLVDENFSSLMLNPELREELKSIEGVVSSLAFEARFCCSMANVIEKLREGDMQS
ncbi:LANT-SPECIFIC COMPONENT OF THE PRE- rRNA PROCESSING COMPLEX2 [Hibiscus trionum]|uniref:LANT-SPECIFIC COMPONENT OF THE PRE- rRNA PROCESSING COMPLEX2 n=1 Tax=Hibiscus trionum TaxID=183268 RepID=A0A9W7MEQ9_HIBTR|nr:LANT-SPECIFIC COMPONENT OF THE PRE- rRNA PROCESSING COMPLEX2 [Hibiscus trionum]GMI95510.1 LANT-SPECIFIC COMPONENT OF THE PRE- rRNA PROCESSING COMPLEX2 [Hibiscus trionum]